MHRQDVLPSARAPRDIEQFLAKIGGKNPYGEPVFRLSVSEGVMKQAGAEYYKWPKGIILRQSAGMFVDNHGQVQVEPAMTPLSIDAEVRWVRKYPALRGWILEEWHPSDRLGNRDEWEAQKVPNHPDVPALGPYPTEGVYMLSLPYGWGQPAAGKEDDPRFQGRPGLPPQSVLQAAVQYVDSCRDFWAGLTPADRRQLWNDEESQRELLEQKHMEDRIADHVSDRTQILLSSSLEAGRYREQLARQAGIKGHVGN